MNIADIYRRGRVQFMGVELLVAPGALVPREETELLGRAALDLLRDPERSAPRVIDMCCGSGNLACGVAHALPRAEVWASDLSDDCTEVARRNVARLDLADRVRVCQGDLFDALRGHGLEGTVDMVVCNPPYIPQRRLDGDRSCLLEHEPRAAFDGGPYGLSIQQRVIREAVAFLRPGGVLLLEIGRGQHRPVQSLFERSGGYADIRLVADAAGDPRVAIGRRI